MKKLCLSVGLVSFAFVVSATPRLEVPAAGVALGEVEAGEALSGEVAVRNVGDSPLHVARVKACCGATATLSAMTVEPNATAILHVDLKPQLPGEISKSVHLFCDDPKDPVAVVPVTGTVRESSDGGNVVSRFRLATIILAGFVDGFNPCAFSIVIVLAGILAVGGRHRRARLIGGCAFCLGSYLTYMLMGLGLMRVLKELDGLSVVRDVVMGLLSASLFVLAFLSFRDAVRYRRQKVPSAITLQLPTRVKSLIRLVAETSWSGSAVAVAGVGCGALVTFLDSLCTGQVYVPVLALLAREPEAWRSFALLAVYNLAFIAPLVAVFVLAAKGADAAQMSRWSKRNIVPSKIALGCVFAILGILLLPAPFTRLGELFK